MYQERHGWERPGWFVPDAVPEVIMVLFFSGNSVSKIRSLNMHCVLLNSGKGV